MYFMCNLYMLYKQEIINQLLKQFQYQSIMEVPRLTKIILSMGLGSSLTKKNILETAVKDLSIITGQQAILTKARKSIASFKIRKGMHVGCKVTLRKQKMWYFYEKLICVAIPRIRDFRGFKLNSFDCNGNYNLGIKEYLIFPEIDYNVLDQIRGLNITICTSSNSKKESMLLLSLLKFPFKMNKYV